MFGGLRLMVMTPLFGELAAVCIEVPLILGFSWLLCARLVLRMRLSSQPVQRLTMGGTAFTLLMIAEWLLAVGLFNNSTAEYLEQLSHLPGAIGLGGQILFALIPWLQLHFPLSSAR